jgi:glycosyltransferase involved in cell wall biosynthesis
MIYRCNIKERAGDGAPFFSVCIPQYSRYEHLLIQLNYLCGQAYKDIEICISDDRSPERRWPEICEFLDRTGIQYTYAVQENNLRYDANLRAAMQLAKGRYLLLMGNDDQLFDQKVLSSVHSAIVSNCFPEVVISNYIEQPAGIEFRRVLKTGEIARGWQGALLTYRNYSFVSGIFLARKEVERFHSTRWDGTEMYQMALSNTIVAHGGRLFGVADIVIRQNIQVPGVDVDSYATKPTIDAKWFVPNKIPLTRYVGTCWDAIGTTVPDGSKLRASEAIYRQFVLFTYPYWVVQYRKTLGFKAAVNVAIACNPASVRTGMPRSVLMRVVGWLQYIVSTACGLSVPIKLFDRIQMILHRYAKRATVT